jgi:hypothetical protein
MAMSEPAEPLSPPAPPHLEFRPEPIFSIGLDIAPMISWYNEMPVLAIAGISGGSADASGIGYTVGITGKKWFGRRWGIRFGVRYMRQHLTAEVGQTISTQVKTDPGDTAAPSYRSVPVTVESIADYDVVQITTALTSELGFFSRNASVALLMSPSFSFVTTSSRLQTVELDASVQGRFFNPDRLPVENDGRRMIVYDAPAGDYYGARPGILAGLELDTPLSEMFSLISSVEYEYVFELPTNDRRNEPVDSLFGRLAIVWNLF